MPKTKNLPRKGEIWLVDFNPARGNEQKRLRPALIIQNDIGNEFSSITIVAAITSTTRIFPIIVPLAKGTIGLKNRLMVNLAQLLTIDKTRLNKRLGRLNPEQIAQVDQAIKISLDIA